MFNWTKCYVICVQLKEKNYAVLQQNKVIEQLFSNKNQLRVIKIYHETLQWLTYSLHKCKFIL